MKRLLAVLFILFQSSVLFAMVVPDRGIFINPLARSITDKGGFLYSIGGWADFSHYISRTDNKHFWSSRFSVYGELYRWGNKHTVYLYSDLELLSSSNSTIHFEPCAFYWQESLFYMNRQEHFTWGIGYYHRCKHDVDNLNGFIRTGQYKARVLIWDSITAKFAWEPLVISWGKDLSTSIVPIVQNHFFVLSMDSVSAAYGPRPYTYTNLINSFSLGAEIDVLRYRDFSVYVHPQFMFDSYNNGEAAITPIDVVIETGIGFRGKNTTFRILCRYESFFDLGVEPWLQSGKYFLIGVKIY